jgi:hypothetical protein
VSLAEWRAVAGASARWFGFRAPKRAVALLVVALLVVACGEDPVAPPDVLPPQTPTFPVAEALPTLTLSTTFGAATTSKEEYITGSYRITGTDGLTCRKGARDSRAWQYHGDAQEAVSPQARHEHGAHGDAGQPALGPARQLLRQDAHPQRRHLRTQSRWGWNGRRVAVRRDEPQRRIRACTHWWSTCASPPIA